MTFPGDIFFKFLSTPTPCLNGPSYKSIELPNELKNGVEGLSVAGVRDEDEYVRAGDTIGGDIALRSKLLS